MGAQNNEGRLRLLLLGGFRVERDGRLVPDDAWERPMARNLVKALALAPAHRLHREQIVDLLWPEADLASGLNSLGKSLHRARKALEPGLTRGPQSRYLHLVENVLSLDGGVWVDLDHFERLATEALTCGEPEALQGALEAYTGELLPENRYADWAEPARERAAELVDRVSLVLAAALEERGALEQAIETVQGVIRRDPAREEAHRRLMRLYALSGDQQGALRQYAMCVEALGRELDVGPEPETQRLYEDILGRRLVPPAAVESEPLLVTLPPTLRRAEDTALVGREPALDFLVEALERAAGGAGDTVLVGGEAGVGKTRLMLELAHVAHQSGALVLWGTSYESEGLLPYGAIVEALEGYLHSRSPDEQRSLAAAYGDVVPMVPSLAVGEINGRDQGRIGSSHDRTRLFATIVRLLADIAGTRYLLLVLDDLHVADLESLQVLHHLARLAPARRWLLVGTYREEDVRPGSEFQTFSTAATRERLLRRLDLRRLGREESEALVQRLLGGEVNPSLVDYLYGQSLGNPLYLQELARSMREAGDLVGREDQWTLARERPRGIPRQVRELIEARVDRMADDVRRVLALAATAGMTVPGTVLRRAAVATLRPPLMDESLFDALDGALQARLLEERGDDYAFRHPLQREALYERLSVTRRSRLHLAVARALEGERPDEVEALAFHYSQTAEQMKAAQYLELAGDRASQVYAFGAAREAYGRALERVGDPAVLSRVERKLGTACYSSGEFAQSVEHFVRAREGETDPGTRVDLWRREMLARDRLGDYDRALAVCEAARAEADAAAMPVTAWADLSLASCEVFQHSGRYDESDATAQRVVEIMGEEGDDVFVARANLALGTTAWRRGRTETAETHVRRALAVAERVGDPVGISSCCTALCSILTAKGRHEEGERYGRRAVEISRRIGNPYDESIGLLNLGVAAFNAGRYREAAVYYGQTLAPREAMGDRYGLAISWVNLAETEDLLGSYTEAEAQARRGVEFLERAGDQAVLAEALRILATILLHQGRLEEAREAYEHALSIFADLGAEAGVAACLVGLGRVRYEGSDVLEALRTARCAAQMRYQGDPAICRSALLLQARSLITARRTRHAERLLRRAGEGAQPEETGRLPIESELLRGELALTMGSITAARMQAEVALDAARDAGLRLEEGQALRLRGECSLRDGNEADAVRDLEAAAEIFAAIGAELESHRTREVTTRAVAP